MSLQSLGRSQMNKMLKLADKGKASVAFVLIDPGVYDPTTGTANETTQTFVLDCFLSRGDDTTTKTPGVLKKSYEVMFTAGQLPREMTIQDEIIISGETYKFSAVIQDTMGVFQKIRVIQA